MRRGGLYLAAEVWPNGIDAIPAGRLPAIPAAVYVADDHQVLKIANR